MNNSKFLTRKRSNSCPEFGQITSNDYSVPIKSRIMFENKAYHFNNSYKDNYYYKRADKSCRGRLKYNLLNRTWEKRFTHSCSIDGEREKSMEQLAKKTEVEAFIKENVESYVLNPSMTPQMIYESVLASLAIKFESRAYAPPLKADIKGIVRRLRNSDVPDIEKIHQAPLCNTVNGLQFFKGKFEIAVRNSFVTCFFWASTEGINLLKQSDHIFIDCTFKSVPKPSKQLLIIMGHHRYTHVYFPGIFVMMDSKNEEAYELVLFIVMDGCRFPSRKNYF